MPTYYNYATTTLQEENINKIEELNETLKTTNSLLGVIAFAIVLQIIISFIRNLL